MKHKSPAVDYRNFRINKINTPEYCHLWWLLFWPAYTLRYFIVENLNPAASYTVIHCALDDVIPFREEFLIFYVLWYAFIVGMHVYTAFYDLDTFRRYSKFLLIAMTTSTTIFLLFPSCQELRPEVFPRDNLLTDIVGILYAVDTNTNVFPSEHVIGSFAVLAAALNCKSLQSPGKITAIAALAILITLSTVFLKQHYVLDMVAALPICAVAYWLCYVRDKKRSAS